MILKKLLAGTSGVVAALMIFTSAAFAGSYVVTRDSVNVRQTAGAGSVVGQVNTNDVVAAVDTRNGWMKIQYGNTYGWVSGQFLKSAGGQRSSNVSRGTSSRGTVYTNSGEVNMRSGPSTDYRVMARLDKGTSLTSMATSDGWTKVQTGSGKTGWVLSKFVSSSSSSSSSARAKTSSRTTQTTSRGGDVRNSGTRGDIVSYAKGFLGTNYVYGGESRNGFDCSGFVQTVFSKYGVSLERVAADQARSNGYKIDKSDLRPGDIVFFDTNGGKNYINHVGVYIGNGNMVHASSGAGEVVTSDISGGFYANAYMTARRVID